MAGTSAATLRTLATSGRYVELTAAIRVGLSLDVLREVNVAPWFTPWRVSAWQWAQLRRAERGLPRVEMPAAPPTPPAGGSPPPPMPPARAPSRPTAFVGFREMRAGESFVGSHLGEIARNRAGIAPTMQRRAVFGTGERVIDTRGVDYLREIDLAASIAQRTRRAHDEAQITERARAQARAMGLGAKPSQATLTIASRFADSLSFEVHVPGTHYSGASNQDIIGWLAASGRDFLADTPELRDGIRASLVDVFSRGAWNVEQAKRVAALDIRAWIVSRFERQGRDVDLASLNPTYRSWKGANGFSTKIGIRTGFLLSNVRRAVVTVTA